MSDDEYIEEIREIIHESNLIVGRSDFGKLDAIPFYRWENFDFSPFQGAIALLKRSEQYSKEIRKALLMYGLPASLHRKFLSPCLKSTPMPNLIRKRPCLGRDYRLDDDFQSLEESHRVAIRNTVYGLIAIGIHLYFSISLSRGQDAVKALYFPGDPSLSLPYTRRLALGIVRDAVVLHRFASLNEFWTCHENIRIRGFRRALYGDLIIQIDKKLVKEILSEDRNALAMYEILLELGFDDKYLQSLNSLDW